MLPHIECKLKQAEARTDGDKLVVSTGLMSREWKWTGAGFATTLVIDAGSGREWKNDSTVCDWQLPNTDEPTGGELVSLSAEVQDDEGFTSEHIAITALIAYPSSGTTLRWSVWAYPNSPGIRTHLSARLDDASTLSDTPKHQGRPTPARAERVPIGSESARRRFIGYYNETQQRNCTHQDLLKEEVNAHPLSYKEWCDWASIACSEDDNGGIALVKESHKCVNQQGYDSGGFVCSEKDGIVSTGWGLRPEEVSAADFTPGWAAWCIVWNGGDISRETAFKSFDKIRYPIDPKRDVYVQANTWGSTPSGEEARMAATESALLEELDSCARLGIDSLQIDDGWQVPPGSSSWKPEDNGWRPHPAKFPGGWQKVKARAAELGINLGLWAAAQSVSLDELKETFTEGGFVQYKLDFANLKTRAQIDELMDKVRAFVKFTNHSVRVNWDVTENPPRYGYFFAREYGCIYLENRKPVRPISVVYRPHTVLRDLWQVAKYLNLHRFQCSVQNVEMVDKELSDAHLHSHSYSTAIALMGIPLFFQQTKYYSDEAASEIRGLLDVYKRHRDALYKGMVHPIGDKPDNASWTGFQCHLAEENCGYLMIFRERCNDSTEGAVVLGWLPEGELNLTDLVSGKSWTEMIDSEKRLSLSIDSAPGFLFLEYQF